jgi:predicted unusual protein kinase regulating ubiquinone biosynthesis (AarF/ABC1/UbiB family)
MTSALGRLFRIGGMATRVSMSLATEQAVGFLFSDPIAQARKTEKLVLNALRATEALGELKGAAMKVGQMLSVHEGLFPREVSAVLRTLQNEAPEVPFTRMEAVLRAELPEFDQHVDYLHPEAIAAASIGQVYRARLHDGREVAVKVQYPDIDRVVLADLKNLKKLFGSLVAMIADVEFDEIWEELKVHLLEELDYRQEAANIERMHELHAQVPEVVVPQVLDELSSQRVLTMEYLPGISPSLACSERFDQSLKDRWGENLLCFVVRGLTEHRFLHADPNFANYAFLDDGRLIVYDHGCVKRVPEQLAKDYRGVLGALIEQDLEGLPERLRAMGICYRRSGEAVPRRLLDPLAREALTIVGSERFRFGRETDIYGVIVDESGSYLQELKDMALPPDLVFVNRTLSGLFGNLCSLGAEGRWRDVLGRFVIDEAR